VYYPFGRDTSALRGGHVRVDDHLSFQQHFGRAKHLHGADHSRQTPIACVEGFVET
jgi:hypothetical protein